MRRTVIAILLVAIHYWSTVHSEAGQFALFTNFNVNEESIVHPYLYLGNGTTLEVSVCVDPSILVNNGSLAEVEASTLEVIKMWNNSNPSIGNIDTMGVDPGKDDFTSILAHEIGHCALALGHPNNDEQVGSPEYTIALVGDNMTLDQNPGPDSVPGSGDDPRGDDQNIFWFQISNNDPFLLANTVDSSTYSRDLMALPPGHSFAANANRLVGALSLPPASATTEAVMFSVKTSGEVTNSLTHDDVAMVLFANSGSDSISGTLDDYQIILRYLGRSADPNTCNVIISHNLAEPFASCDVGSISIGDNHFRLAGNSSQSGLIELSPFANWSFRSIFANGFESGDTSLWSSTVP